ncbi:MAG: chorismate-binding protein [Imperialibacter sp.]|uniref:chorismate-binding protein n=1 Tax=Imperialibacter sp. TaxID=2038411 RepID=UPI003A8571DA
MKEKSSTETEIRELNIRETISGAINGKKSFAFWKKQGQPQLQGIVDLGEQPSTDKGDLEEASPGFIVSPFLNEGRKKNIKINADLVFTPTDNSSGFQVNPAVGVSNEQTDSFIQGTFEALRSASLEAYVPATDKVAASQKGDFIDIVNKAKENIKAEVFNKVVPSRYTDVSYPTGWDFISAFEKLHQLYPNAFVYVFGIPGVGIWMGATPELLLSIVDGRWFKSVALAGTQKIPESGELSQVAWTQKEIEEQALVCRYIINCFKKIRLREYEEKGPKSIKAGNMAHLKTEFYVDMEAVNFPQLGSVMLDLLHPTSAVCGMPLEPSLQFLKQFEGFDREFYTGYLGPVNMQGSTQLYVNLRSMKLLSDRARLFAGAGVTEDSIAEKEFEETELKLQTLMCLF